MICVSVQEKDFARCREILANCGMAELRGDLCNFTTPQIEELVQSHPNLLYTHRIANSSLERAREQVTTAIKKGVKYVDIEIEAPVDYLEYVKSYARVNGCTLIISYHNFEGTQSLEELQTIYDICRRKGADIVKIVTTAHNTADATRVMQLYSYRKRDSELVPDNFLERGEETGSLSNSFGTAEASLVAFCMGEAGKFTRHLCLKLGAPYTYVAQDAESATAPGQYTKAEMEALLDSGNYPYRTLPLKETVFYGKNPAVRIPCSKSMAQRAILAAAFACGTTVLKNFEPCNDTLGALEVIRNLGAEVSVNGTTVTIESKGAESLKGCRSIFTGESGLLTRLLVPLAAYLTADGGEIGITGHGSILKRNLGESAAALEAAGAKCLSNGGFLPFTVSAPEGIASHIEFSGKASSQIVSGFLMMLPLMENDSILTITEPASIPYIELTLRVLEKFGIRIQEEKQLPERIIYRIPGKQKYTPAGIYLDADWSSASNFAVAGALLQGVTLLDMPLDSAQADEKILDILQEYGCRIEKRIKGSTADITIAPAACTTAESTFGKSINLGNCPDLFPTVALLACHSQGTTVLEGAGRLAQKESNRAESIYAELAKLGYGITIDGDKMYICGKGTSLEGTPGQNNAEEFLGCGYNDHRIAMMLYIEALLGNRKISIDNTKCIDKSFPSFLERLKK